MHDRLGLKLVQRELKKFVVNIANEQIDGQILPPLQSLLY